MKRFEFEGRWTENGFNYQVKKCIFTPNNAEDYRRYAEDSEKEFAAVKKMIKKLASKPRRLEVELAWYWRYDGTPLDGVRFIREYGAFSKRTWRVGSSGPGFYEEEGRFDVNAVIAEVDSAKERWIRESAK